jgi:hypothetical protein
MAAAFGVTGVGVVGVPVCAYPISVGGPPSSGLTQPVRSAARGRGWPRSRRWSGCRSKGDIRP